MVVQWKQNLHHVPTIGPESLIYEKGYLCKAHLVVHLCPRLEQLRDTVVLCVLEANLIIYNLQSQPIAHDAATTATESGGGQHSCSLFAGNINVRTTLLLLLSK